MDRNTNVNDDVVKDQANETKSDNFTTLTQSENVCENSAKTQNINENASEEVTDSCKIDEQDDIPKEKSDSHTTSQDRLTVSSKNKANTSDEVKVENESDDLDSSSEEEYESADEGEIEIEEEQLKLVEEKMNEEEKILKKEEAQNYKQEGNKVFKEKFYKEAIKYYSRALHICPYSYFKERSIMYSNRAACKLHLEKYEEALKDCTKAIDLHPHYLKAVLRRAEIYEKVEKLEEALADYQRVVELDPSHHVARRACMRLPEEIKEKNEKMKEEMMGKLKDLGNMVLKPFGLSTNNFKLNQDPKTGGYSVNFVQNSES